MKHSQLFSGYRYRVSGAPLGIIRSRLHASAHRLGIKIVTRADGDSLIVQAIAWK